NKPQQFVPEVESASARLHVQLSKYKRALQVRMSELEAAERHIAQLEGKLLKVKQYRNELRSLKEQKQVLLKSPERRIGRVLLAPYRLLEHLIKVIRKKLFRVRPGKDSSASSEYHKWLQRHRPTARDLDRMRQEALGFAFQPLISIITPVFNTPPRWLRECVESVLTQTYEKWELILIDDGSTELATLQSLTELAASDSRIMLAKNEKTRGISAASNRGLALARGDWVGFLDHDDLLEVDALFQNVEWLQDHPDADLIY